ncbi:hypothetical protein WME89_27700 [Sorangium sp. So ce321]|uniref:hypothetical protein n=1 Tax=Sorangium sp. So ce321 TaxID=3133300 RepID=UPI003F60795F
MKGFGGRSEYRTEDDEMSMILALDGASGGGPGAFEVRTRDGRIRIYEETYATRVVATGDAEQPAGIVTPLCLATRGVDSAGACSPPSRSAGTGGLASGRSGCTGCTKTL